MAGGRRRAFGALPALLPREAEARPERNVKVEVAQQFVLLSCQRRLRWQRCLYQRHSRRSRGGSRVARSARAIRIAPRNRRGLARRFLL